MIATYGPGLTLAQRQLLQMEHDHFNLDRMAATLNISKKSLYHRRWRLRHKLDLLTCEMDKSAFCTNDYPRPDSEGAM